MALLFCDSFDHYALADMVLKWSYIESHVSLTTGRFGSGLWAANENHYVQKTLLTNSTTGGISFAHNFVSGIINTGPARLAGLEDGGTTQVDLRVGSNGVPYVTRNGTVLGTCSYIVGAGWHWYDFKAKIDGSVGTIDVLIDGVSVLSLTGQNTRATGNSYFNGFRLSGLVNSQPVNHAWDDVIVWNDQGSGLTNYPGDCRVQAIFPSGAGNTTQMTPSAGNNYACVDETSPNGDTDYVSETSTGEKDTYAFGDLTPTSGTIKGVQVLVNARKDDAGSRSIAPVYRPSSTDYDGTTVSVSDSYAYYGEITEVSPATSSAWTISEINGAEFGVKLIS